MLTIVLRPEKSTKEYQGKQHAAPNQKVNYTHSNLRFFAARWVAKLVNEMIVTVLNGIRMAAMTGDSLPVTAKLKPARL